MKHQVWLYLTIAAAGTAAGFAQTTAVDAAPKAIPRTPEGKPDFTGYYNLQYTPNMAMGKEDLVPYTPAGKAAYAGHDAKDDPTSNCWLPGVPRIMQSPYPTQFVQTPTHLVILFEYMHTFRSFPLNGRPHPSNMEPAFRGKPERSSRNRDRCCVFFRCWFLFGPILGAYGADRLGRDWTRFWTSSEGHL